MHLVSCTNTHHDIIDLVINEMVKTTKLEYLDNRTQILYKKKILNLSQVTHFAKLLYFGKGNL